MSKVESFNKRKGIVDAFGLTESLADVAGDIDLLVVVSVMKDGEIIVGHTEGSVLQKIGLVEAAKNNLLLELGY